MDIDKSILVFICREKGYRTADAIWKEKNAAGGRTLSDFNTYYRGTLINSVEDDSVVLAKEQANTAMKRHQGP